MSENNVTTVAVCSALRVANIPERDGRVLPFYLSVESAGKKQETKERDKERDGRVLYFYLAVESEGKRHVGKPALMVLNGSVKCSVALNLIKAGQKNQLEPAAKATLSYRPVSFAIYGQL